MYQLKQNILNLRKQKEILLVSHVVYGFPDFEQARQSVQSMAKAGVEIIEIQLPFSDPQADGPFLSRAQTESLENGGTTKKCFSFAKEVCRNYPQVNFLFMTYLNIAFQYGLEKFVKEAGSIGIKGIILPDLPIEEADEFVGFCEGSDVAPIFLFTPTTSDERMKQIAEKAGGFTYCQARVGVTGTHTKFDNDTLEYIEKCQKNSKPPIAFGFGIQEKADVDFLKGKVDIAICCTAAVKILEKDGAEAMGEFLKGLR